MSYINRSFAILLSVLFLNVSLTFSGEIKGKVTTKSGKPIKDAVVYIEKIAGKTFAPSDVHTVVDQKNLTFVPHILPVLFGTTVDFLNSDDVLHHFFSPDKCVDKFNLGSWPKGKKRSFTFKNPGCVAVLLCNVHPEMEAYILVVDTPYFSASLENGSYVLKDVPAGKYTLKVWHNRLKGENVEITVPESGDVTVDFQIMRKRR